MGVPGHMGWKIPAISDAGPEVNEQPARLLGIVELSRRYCHEIRDMKCSRFADGPLGTHEALHFLCPVCGGKWRADKSGNDATLATMKN